MHRRAETKRENRDNCRTQTVLSERDHGYLAVLKEGKLEMISVEDLDHDKICRLKETYALRSFEEIRKEELLSDNPCYQIQMLNKTKNGEKDKNILKCKNLHKALKIRKSWYRGNRIFGRNIFYYRREWSREVHIH